MKEEKPEWKLDAYFYDSLKDPKIEADLQEYKDTIKAFVKKYTNNIANLSEAAFREFYDEMDCLDIKATKISSYLGYAASLDTQNQEGQKKSTKINKIFSEYSEKMLFLHEEYKKIGYERLVAISNLENMKPYKNAVLNHANSLKYILEEREESLIMKMSTAYDHDLYEQLTSSFSFDFYGRICGQEEVRSFRESRDRLSRKEAFESLAKVFTNTQNQIVLGNLYALVCKGDVFDTELRKYDTVMSSRNISEEVSDQAVDFLISRVEKHYPLYHKFLKKKAEILGLDKLENYDIFAPLSISAEVSEYSFQDGWDLYMNAFKDVDPKLYDFSKEMLESNRISVYPREGKTSGAFASYSKGFPEFVLLNWTNSYSDVTTLAHEMGHAFHGRLSQVQTHMTYGTPLTLAETASIFNETMMFEKLLEATEDKDVKRKLIYDRLDDLFGTIFRQVMYTRFEKQCHESFLNNEPMTYSDFNELWLSEVKKLYGDNVNVDENMSKAGWSAIPHIFHTPFYCYTYAFGNIISLNIYQGYKQATDKEDFLEKYHKFLSAGGSDTPENLLNDIFGIKFNDDFYALAFTHIEELISKLD